MQFRDVTEFLLTPALVACRHPPAPMANQISRVISDVGVDMSFDPVIVTGVVEAALTLDGLTGIRYRMRATQVTSGVHPDVTE